MTSEEVRESKEERVGIMRSEARRVKKKNVELSMRQLRRRVEKP